MPGRQRPVPCELMLNDPVLESWLAGAFVPTAKVSCVRHFQPGGEDDDREGGMRHLPRTAMRHMIGGEVAHMDIGSCAGDDGGRLETLRAEWYSAGTVGKVDIPTEDDMEWVVFAGPLCMHAFFARKLAFDSTVNSLLHSKVSVILDLDHTVVHCWTLSTAPKDCPLHRFNAEYVPGQVSWLPAAGGRRCAMMRVDPSNPSTAVMLHVRDGWFEHLRRVLTDESVDVFVCSAGDHEYARKVWDVLDCEEPFLIDPADRDWCIVQGGRSDTGPKSIARVVAGRPAMPWGFDHRHVGGASFFPFAIALDDMQMVWEAPCRSQVIGVPRFQVDAKSGGGSGGTLEEAAFLVVMHVNGLLRSMKTGGW